MSVRPTHTSTSSHSGPPIFLLLATEKELLHLRDDPNHTFAATAAASKVKQMKRNFCLANEHTQHKKMTTLDTAGGFPEWRLTQTKR